MIRRDSFLVLDLRLDIIDRVGELDFKSDGLANKGLDEDLHTRQAKDWVAYQRVFNQHG